MVKEKTIKGLKEGFSNMYEKHYANNKVHLMKKWFILKMGEGTPVVGHLNEFKMIVNQLSSVEINFDDEVVP